jgi:PIN domain nuclease of toxin-antitoxin system
LAAAAGADTWENPDPADRIIVWTAKLYELELVHTDREIALRMDLKQSFYPRG